MVEGSDGKVRWLELSAINKSVVNKIGFLDISEILSRKRSNISGSPWARRLGEDAIS